MACISGKLDEIFNGNITQIIHELFQKTKKEGTVYEVNIILVSNPGKVLHLLQPSNTQFESTALFHPPLFPVTPMLQGLGQILPA